MTINHIVAITDQARDTSTAHRVIRVSAHQAVGAADRRTRQCTAIQQQARRAAYPGHRATVAIPGIIIDDKITVTQHTDCTGRNWRTRRPDQAVGRINSAYRTGTAITKGDRASISVPVPAVDNIIACR